jgi:hypothetical protein
MPGPVQESYAKTPHATILTEQKFVFLAPILCSQEAYYSARFQFSEDTECIVVKIPISSISDSLMNIANPAVDSPIYGHVGEW